MLATPSRVVTRTQSFDRNEDSCAESFGPPLYGFLKKVSNEEGVGVFTPAPDVSTNQRNSADISLVKSNSGSGLP